MDISFCFVSLLVLLQHELFDDFRDAAFIIGALCDVICLGFYLGRGIFHGHAEPRRSNHRQIVVEISDRDHLAYVDPQDLPQLY